MEQKFCITHKKVLFDIIDLNESTNENSHRIESNMVENIKVYEHQLMI